MNLIVAVVIHRVNLTSAVPKWGGNTWGGNFKFSGPKSVENRSELASRWLRSCPNRSHQLRRSWWDLFGQLRSHLEANSDRFSMDFGPGKLHIVLPPHLEIAQTRPGHLSASPGTGARQKLSQGYHGALSTGDPIDGLTPARTDLRFLD